MSSTVPTWEPRLLTAGDRWLWERQDLADYPAGTWTLSYSLAKADRQITLTATASGGAHRIDVSAATTAAYPAGRYSWAAYVAYGSDRRQVASGEIEIRPNLATATSGIDGRSFARQMLDAVEAQILGRATQSQSDMVAYQIAGRNLQRDPAALVKLRDAFKAEVRSESISDRLASGMDGGPRLLARI